MTTITFKAGVLAADSRCTHEDEAGGHRVYNCEKLFAKSLKWPDGKEEDVILATAGDSSAAMVFVDWYGSGKDMPELLVHGGADFTVLILKADGLYEVDMWCRPVKVLEPFYAIGSGTKAALGAMAMGASALKAVQISAKYDPYTAPPFVTMKLKGPPKPKRKPAVKTTKPATDVIP